MPVIGKRFSYELEAAGILGLSFGWDENGVYGLDNLSEQDRVAVEAVISAHDPLAQPPRFVPRRNFLDGLVAEGKYHDFVTWRDEQDPATIVYFLEEPGFIESDARMDAAMTAVALNKSAFVTNALTS